MRPVLSRCFVMPEITLDRARCESLREQLYSQIAGDIRRGALAEGARLPSTRLLARLLDVSRNTVVDAYERLLEQGLVSTRAGSGVTVKHSGRSAVPNFGRFREITRKAHYPSRTVRFEDLDGTALYLNVPR